MEVKIPFNDWSKSRLSFTKTATSRSKKYGNIQDYFYIDKMKFELDLVIELPFWFIIKFLWRTEGAVSPDELFIEWLKIHPKKGMHMNKVYWYHHFKMVDTDI